MSAPRAGVPRRPSSARPHRAAVGAAPPRPGRVFRPRAVEVLLLGWLGAGGLAPAASAERVLRAGETLPGIMVEVSDTDPDLRKDPQASRTDDENRRAVNRPPRLLKTVPTRYPEDLKGSGVVGEVMVTMLVDRLGRASHIRVEQSPDELFTDSALESLAQWEFLPALRNSRVTNAKMRVNILVAEEVGDTTYFDFAGGRISLEGVTYAGQHEHDIQRIFGLRPVYPFEMLVEAKPGEVILEFSVENEGVPYDMTVLEATHKEFALAAEAAMGHWKFSPALHEGNTVPARLRYRISFQPDDYPPHLLEMARRIQAGDLEGFVSSKLVDDPPQVLRTLQPTLLGSEAERSARHRVTVNVVITATGEVLLPRIQAAPDPLVGYAAATVMPYWRFRPAYREKQPVQVLVSLPLVF